MNSCFRPFALLLVLASVLASSACSGGNNDGGGAGGATSGMIGAGGGQLALPGGGGFVSFPAGAVAADTMVTITAIDPALVDPDLAAIAGARAFEFAPIGLALMQPASFVVDNPPVPVSTLSAEGGAKSNQVALEVKFIEIDNALSSPPHLDFDFVDATGASTISTDFDALGRAILLDTNGAYRITVNRPISIEAGMPDAVQVELIASNGFSFNSAPVLTWNANPLIGSMLSISLGGSPSPFASGMTAPTTPGTGLADTFSISCLPGAVGTQSYNLQVNMTGVSGAFTSRPNRTLGQTTGLSMALEVTCKPSNTGSVQQQLVDLGGIIQGIEAINPVPPGLSCKGPNGLDILIAGQQLGNTDAKAIVVDPVTGIVTEQFDLPGGFPVGAAFDAHFILPPPGATGLDPRLIATGNGSVEKIVQSNCSLSALTGFGFSFNLDTAYVNNDPTLGISSANAAGIDLRYLDQGVGGVMVEQIPLSSGIRTSLGNAARDRFLVVSDSGQLVNVTWDGTTATETPVAGVTLGANPRRMRWDPATGIVAISDLNDDTITVLFWDGAQNVALIGTANVGAGPVGVDVMGGKIVCCGFNDGSLSFIDVDTVMLQITNTTTIANPFPLGQNPGHAVFLRDPDNSVAISYNVNSMLGLLPNAY